VGGALTCCGEILARAARTCFSSSLGYGLLRFCCIHHLSSCIQVPRECAEDSNIRLNPTQILRHLHGRERQVLTAALLWAALCGINMLLVIVLKERD
jgi:hypothetical protein